MDFQAALLGAIGALSSAIVALWLRSAKIEARCDEDRAQLWKALEALKTVSCTQSACVVRTAVPKSERVDTSRLRPNTQPGAL